MHNMLLKVSPAALALLNDIFFAGSAEISNSIFNTFWEIEAKERRKAARLAAHEEDPEPETRRSDDVSRTWAVSLLRLSCLAF